jgi:AraC family transcriptional regulator
MQTQKQRLEQVKLYIEENLAESINTRILADLGHYSYYHFDRIFSQDEGEPVWHLVKRLRLERAAYLLQFSSLSVADIAEAIGYASNASFTKAFTQYFNGSPTAFKRIPKPAFDSADYRYLINHTNPSLIKMPAWSLLFIRTTGHFRYEEAWNRMHDEWVQTILTKEQNRLSQGFFAKTPDIPGITTENKIRYDLGLSIREDTPIDQHTRRDLDLLEQTIPEGKYALFLHQGASDTLSTSYRAIYYDWLPKNGYGLRNAPWYQQYLPSSNTESNTEDITHIYIPVA